LPARRDVACRIPNIAASRDSHGSDAALTARAGINIAIRAAAVSARKCEGYRRFSSDKAMCI
jgi:hypothetical protein